MNVTKELEKEGRKHIKIFMDELANDPDFQGNLYVDQYRREKKRKERLEKLKKINENT